MKRTNLLQAWAVMLSSAGMILPQLAIAETTEVTKAETAPIVTDVALATGGVLRGQVVDPQGQPVAKASVTILHEGKAVASTVTGDDGSFAVGGLRGGLHVVASGENGGVCRMWAPDSAPPAANQALMIVRGGEFARGGNGGAFSGFGGKGLLMVGVLGGIVAGGLTSQGNHGGSGS